MRNGSTHSIAHNSTSGIERTSISNVPTPDSATRQRKEKRRYRIVLGAFFWCFFLMGLNDGSIGPLLPVFREYYHISFIAVSTIFITTCLGCLTSALLNVLISRYLALSKIILLAASFQLVAYSIISSAPPFPVVCVACFMNGMGMSLLNAQCNALLSMLHDSTVMGFALACYGAGALVSPLISTQFADYYAETHQRYWTLFYTVLMGAALSNLISFGTLFKGAGYEEILSSMGVSKQEEIQLQRPQSRAEDPRANAGTTQAEEGSRSSKDENTFALVLKQVHVHTLAAFIFIYVGVEVTIGGWIVTFMINERGGGPSSGYVSSGFFAGLALGRVALLKVTQLLGERNAIFLYTAIGIALEITIWFVPSLIENAIAVSFAGMALGPFFPIVMSQTGRIIPRKLLSGSIGWIAGFGQSGSAILPFVTGALANKYGIIALQPFIVAMMAAMAGLWFLVPSIPKRMD